MAYLKKRYIFTRIHTRFYVFYIYIFSTQLNLGQDTGKACYRDAYNHGLQLYPHKTTLLRIPLHNGCSTAPEGLVLWLQGGEQSRVHEAL